MPKIISFMQKSPVQSDVHPQAHVRKLEGQLAAVRAIGSALAASIGLDAAFARIVPNVTKLMHVERTTLYLYDDDKKEIWSKIAEGEEEREIRLPLGQGVAGWVALHCRPARIEDAQADSLFHATVDAETGFHTRNVLAVPLTSRTGRLLGVLEVLNRIGEPFSDDDVALLDAIGAQVAYAVENAQLSQRILDQNRELEVARQRADRRAAELDLLYQFEQETSASADLDELLDSIIVRACARLHSDAGAVLLTDVDTGRLFFRGVSGSKKSDLKMVTLESGEGVVGWVAQSGEAILINHPEDDLRYNGELARKISYPVYALLAVPLIWDQKIIGAVEVLNPGSKMTGVKEYDVEDMKVLTLIAGQVARAVMLTLERQARLDMERLAVIGRMLAGVAHDLRSPLTAISGLAQLMAMENDAAKRQVRCDRVLSQIDDMTAMVGDLLAFTRGESRLSPTPVLVTQLAGDAEETINAYCKPRGIALCMESRGGMAVIDPGRTKRILYNLAKNAAEALGKGGQLVIHLDEQNGGLNIQVSDNGPGIPREVQARLFQPFVTASKINGTGLGLSIVKRFVDDQRGEIAVESTPGVGTTFKVFLPNTQSFTA